MWTCAANMRAMGKDALPALRKAAGGRATVPAKLALGWALLSLQDFTPGVKVLGSIVSGPPSICCRIGWP